MTSFHDWMHLLRCPDCQEGFRFQPAPNESRDDVRYGVLECPCFRYPVVDGVPVLLKGNVGLFAFWSRSSVESQGPDVAEVAELVAAGRGSEALVRCLAFTPGFLNRIANSRYSKMLPAAGRNIAESLPEWRIWRTGPVPELSRKWVEGRLRTMLNGDRNRLCAEDLFEFYFGALTPGYTGNLHYYRHRFALPRTLAALSLLRLLPASDKPMLDLACGFGPFAHYLTKRRNPTPVIGADFNFYLVWGQKHLIAPEGAFVCADANCRLPFADDAFSGVFCSDAFIYFNSKLQALAEFNRCAPRAPIILTRIGNRLVSPKDGDDALAPNEYAQLLSAGAPRGFSEHALVRHYLAGRNPLHAQPTDPADLNWDKWLTFVANGDTLKDVVVDPAEEWPHEVGELTFNPIFDREILPSGRCKLSFQFPNTWFAYQNGDMYGYHGDRVECSPRLPLNHADTEVRKLIERFVLIGLPERYLKTQLRP